MLIRKKLLSDDFRNEIMAFARQGVEVNEQSQMTKFFAQKKYRLRIVSSEYNFHESYLASVDPEDARKLLAQVRILHYPGGEKPWKADPSTALRPSMKLWWDAHAIWLSWNSKRRHRRPVCSYAAFCDVPFHTGAWNETFAPDTVVPAISLSVMVTLSLFSLTTFETRVVPEAPAPATLKIMPGRKDAVVARTRTALPDVMAPERVRLPPVPSAVQTYSE